MDFGEGMIGRGDSWSLVSFWKPWKLVTRNQTWHAIINHQSWSCQYSFGSPVQPRWIGVLSNFDWIYEVYFRWIKVPIIFTFKSSIVPNQVLLYSTRLYRSQSFVSSTQVDFQFCPRATSEASCCCLRNQPWSMNLLEKWHKKVGKGREWLGLRCLGYFGLLVNIWRWFHWMGC